jgi:hypothetical protein
MKTFRYIGKGHSMKVLAYFTATLMLVAIPLAAGPVTNPIPWFESFETYIDGLVLNDTNGWYTSADPQAVATNVGASPASVEGVNICYLPSEGVLTNWINSAAASVVWFDMFAKISLREEPPAIDSSTTSMFYFNTNGHAVVQDGPSSNWITLSNNMFSAAVDGIAATNWTRVTVVHNYTDKKWALFVDGELLKDNIRFINSASKMSAMVVSNQVYLDSMVVTEDFPDGQIYAANTNFTGDADGDSLLDYVEIDYFGYVSTQNGSDDSDGDGRSNASELGRLVPTDPTNPNDFSLELPFRDGFESATVGAVTTNYWRGLTNFGTIAVSGSEYIEGSKSLGVHTGSVHVVVDDADATNIWVQVYSKVQPFTDVPADDSLDANQVMGFFVLTNGNLYAYDGDHWTNTAAVSSVGTNLWLGFAVHLDYTAKRYDLYVSTNNIYGGVLKRAHTNYLAFNEDASGVAYFTKMVVTNEANGYAYIDAVAVSHAYTNAGVESLTNLLAYDRIAGQTTMAQMPPYNYTGADDLLNGQVGRDLTRELSEGDKLHVYSNGWNVYFINLGQWQEESGAGIADLEINATMGMQIQRVGSGVDAVAFYPYSNFTASVSEVYVYGTNDLDMTFGWNQFTSPFSGIRYPNDPVYDYGFMSPTNGDTIYLAGKRLFFNGTEWRQNSYYATNALLPGAGFWYYHRGTGMIWNVSE